jgi:hypothetical protein
MELEEFLDNTPDMGRYMGFLKRFREKVQASALDGRAREALLKEAGSKAAFTTLRQKGLRALRDELNARLKQLVTA